MKTRDELVQDINGLECALQNAEAALAQADQDLLAYKDYYGTTVAQVKHLASCSLCSAPGVDDPWHCPNYPSSEEK